MTLAPHNTHPRHALEGKALVAALASAWAFSLAAAGLWAALRGEDASGFLADTFHTKEDLWRPILGGAAVLFLAGGEFVFMTLVADPLFPHANRLARRRVEWGVALLLLGALLWIAWSVVKMVA